MTSPARVEQIIDHDAYSVTLTLDPAQIIDALAEALRTYAGTLALVRHLPAEHPEHVHARSELVRVLADVFTVTLTKKQADEFGGDLWDATQEPSRCHWDEKFSTVTVDGVRLCDGHARAYDQAEALS